jgi:hypothetical protein
MQGDKSTFLDFSRRTAELAAARGCDVQDLAAPNGPLGFSRASLFAYRTGKAKITDKAWAKLAAAEREAGIGAPAHAPPAPPSSPAPKSFSEMSLADLLESLPEAARPVAARFGLKTMEIHLIAHLTGAENLAHGVLARHSPGTGNLAEDHTAAELESLADEIIAGTETAKQLVIQLVAALSGEGSEDLDSHSPLRN